MAPEIIRGQQPTVHTDIWALGILLFELVAGHRPFCGRTPYELAANILANELAPTETLVQGPIRKVIDRCLCGDPADRYESMRDVGDDLSSLSIRRPAAAVENPASLPV
jgi:serine/threonine-protein kinase